MDLLRESYGDDDADNTSSSSGSENRTTKDVLAAGVARGSAGRKRSRDVLQGGQQQQQKQQQQQQFVRAVPHTPGNWAGHVFCPLLPTHAASSSSAVGTPSSRYDGINRAASRKLCDVGRELSEEFARALCDRQQKQQRRGDERDLTSLVVSHLPAIDSGCDNESVDDSSSSSSCSSSDEDDTDNNGDRRAGDSTEKSASQGTNNSSIPLHVSLSRPFYLQLQSIPTFVDQLSRTLAIHPPIPITFDANRPQVLVNDEGTRSFLTIPATSASTQHEGGCSMIKLISSIDVVMKRFGEPTYYDDPKIHVSIASVPGDVGEILDGLYGLSCHNDGDGGKNTGNDTNRTSNTVGGGDRPSITFMIDRVCCTFGTTKEYYVLLKS